MEEKTYTVIELAETLGVARPSTTGFPVTRSILISKWSEDAASTPNRRSPC